MPKTPSRTGRPEATLPCMRRRDLLKLPIPICVVAAVGSIPARALAGAATHNVQGDLRLCTYCGIYCGLCDMYQGKGGLHATELDRLLRYFGLTSETFTADADSFASFQNVLGLVGERLADVAPCKGGCDLFPGCEIRPCAEERGVETCAFCEKFPCSKIEEFSAQFNTIPNLERQEEIGLQAWADEMAATVEQGVSFAGPPPNEGSSD